MSFRVGGLGEISKEMEHGENVIFYVEMESPFRRIFVCKSRGQEPCKRFSFFYFPLLQNSPRQLYSLDGWVCKQSLWLKKFEITVALCISSLFVHWPGCLFVCLFVCLSLSFRVSSTNQ